MKCPPDWFPALCRWAESGKRCTVKVLGCSLPLAVRPFFQASFQTTRSGLLTLVIATLALSPLAAGQQNGGGTAGAAAGAPVPASTAGASRTAGAQQSGNSAAISNPAGAPIATAPTHAIATEPTRSNDKRRKGKYDVTRIGQRGIGGGLNLYSLEKERAMGHELAMQVEQSVRLISDPVITEYVNRVGQNIVRNSDARVPFIIKVIDDDQVNAFALPGGYFYVNSGLIMAADSEAALAGVMAHEIAHVAARHATKNATKAEIFNLASIPLIFMGGPAGYAIRQVAGFAVPMSFLKFSRDAEREADLLGLEYEYAAGYDPAEFVSFFEELKAHDKEKHSIIAKAFSTHPMTDDRIKRAQKEIETMLPPKDQYVVSTSEFDEVKARLTELVHQGKLYSTATDRPTLRRRGPEETSGPSKDKDDDRPTLKRR